MTIDFDEFHDMLNGGGRLKIEEAMSDWHPAILGQLLEAIAKAKQHRYPLNHPDFNRGVEAVIAAKGRTL